MSRTSFSAPIDPTDRFTTRIRALEEQVAELQRPRRARVVTYTPTLTAMSVGTTSSINTAKYVYSGGALVVQGELQWGSAGTRTYPTSTSRIGLPSGFTAEFIDNDQIVGDCLMRTSTGAGLGSLSLPSATAMRPLANVVSGSNVTLASPTASVPGTWAPGDRLVWHAVVIGSFS